MKSYFAKGFPIKGEIRKEDYTPAQLTAFEHGFSEPTKLFLCSRDIVLHEECWLENEKVIPNQIHAELRSKCYKIIGEISPQALWVEEGDEWDEDEVRVCGQQILVDKETFNSDPRSWTEDEYKVVFVGKIKGLCGHFH